MNTVQDLQADAALASTPSGSSETAQVRALLQLRELILSGELPGGTRIAELAIVERLGMSRTPIRAALVRLEQEGLLENVTRVSAYLRKTCKVGPVVDFQGLGFLHGLRLDKPARDVQKALLAKDILAGTAGDPAILRLLPAFILKEEHIDRLRDALTGL